MDDRMLTAVDPDGHPQVHDIAIMHDLALDAAPVHIEMVLVDVGDQHSRQPGERLKAARKAARVDRRPPGAVVIAKSVTTKMTGTARQPANKLQPIREV